MDKNYDGNETLGNVRVSAVAPVCIASLLTAVDYFPVTACRIVFWCWCHQHDENVLWIVFVGETFTAPNILLILEKPGLEWPPYLAHIPYLLKKRAPTGSRTRFSGAPTRLSSCSTSVTCETMTNIHTACLGSVQLKRFLPVNSVYARSVQDDVADERQDEDVRGIPAGRDEVSGCV